MKKAFLTAITAGLFALNQMSFAATENFTVSLDAAQAGTVGAGGTGSGSGTLSYDTVASTLTLNNITYSGLSANSTFAHIHGSDTSVPGQSAGVLYDLAGFTTLGGTSGAFNGTVPLVDGTGGFSLAQQISQLEGGLWYINIHSANFGGGEIRGQILPVPEPSSLALLGLGAGALVWRLRRRS